jgi:hypothetical protein
VPTANRGVASLFNMLFIVFTFLSPKITKCAATALHFSLRNAVPNEFPWRAADATEPLRCKKPLNRLPLHHCKAKNQIRLRLA